MEGADFPLGQLAARAGVGGVRHDEGAAAGHPLRRAGGLRHLLSAARVHLQRATGRSLRGRDCGRRRGVLPQQPGNRAGGHARRRSPREHAGQPQRRGRHRGESHLHPEPRCAGARHERPRHRGPPVPRSESRPRVRHAAEGPLGGCGGRALRAHQRSLPGRSGRQLHRILQLRLLPRGLERLLPAARPARLTVPAGPPLSDPAEPRHPPQELRRVGHDAGGCVAQAAGRRLPRRAGRADRAARDQRRGAHGRPLAGPAA